MAELWKQWQADSLASESVAASLKKKDFDLVDLVGHLGPPLTSLNVNERAWACELLAAVLHKLGSDYPIQASECSLLCMFFCDRLRDTPCVKQSLDGLLSLVVRGTCTEENAERILRAMFAELDVQALPQDARVRIFRILSQLDNRHQAYLVSAMGPDFVFGVLRSMDGEKDPRCLVLVFELLPRMIRAYPIDRFVEELFDLTACYFPITFTPPPNNTLGITKNDLVEGLRRCLAASPLFAPMCVELLLEKLASTSMEAKEESLRTLAECVTQYGGLAVQPFASRLLPALRIESVHGAPTIQPLALAALTALAASLSAAGDEALGALVDPLCDEVKRHLTDHDVTLVAAHGKMAVALALGAAPACARVLSAVVPALLADFAVNEAVAHRAAVVGVLAGLLRACSKHESALPGISLALAYADAVLGVFQTAAASQAVDLSVAGLSGLGALSGVAALPKPLLVLCARSLAAVLCEAAEPKVVREAVAAARALGSTSAAVLINQVVSVLQAHVAENKRVDHIFQVLAGVCCIGAVLAVVVDFCVAQLAGASLENAARCVLSAVCACKISEEDAKVVLDGSLARLTSFLCSGQESTSKPAVLAPILSAYRDLFARAAEAVQVQQLALFAEATKITFANPSLESLPRPALLLYMHLLLGLRRTLVPQLPASAALYEALTALALQDDPFSFSAADETMAAKNSAEPAPPPSSHSLSAIASASAPSLPSPSPPTLTAALVDTAASARWALAALVNKHPDGELLRALIASVSLTTASAGVSPEAQSRPSVLLLGALALALVMRNHPLGILQARNLAAMLGAPGREMMAAEAVSTLVATTPLTLTAHCVVGPLYRQRVFVELLAVVVEQYKAGGEARQAACMVALEGLVAGVPRQVLVDELPTVLPLLLEALNSSHVSGATLATLASLAGPAEAVLSQHLATLVPRLLALTRHATMTVRIAALDALCALTVLPTHKLYPHARGVVRMLAEALDDKKRLVRVRAVLCRSKWFSICGPAR